MSELVLIADPKILKIPVIECGEVLIDIKNTKTLLYGPVPETELSTAYYTKMRQTIYEKLLRVEESLPKGMRLRLYEGYRSMGVQQLLFDQTFAKNQQKFPHFSSEELFLESLKLVSPVTNLDGSLNIPPHSTGAAVDVEIVDENGILLDFGMTSEDALIVIDPDLSKTHSSKISPYAQKNRQLLLDAMQAQGFVNYPYEWWHFSYGDKYWAYMKGEPYAIYSTVEAT